MKRYTALRVLLKELGAKIDTKPDTCAEYH